MSYPSSFGRRNKPDSTRCVVGLEDHERQSFIHEVIVSNGGYRTVKILEKIPNNSGNLDYRYTCELHKKPGSSIAVGIAHVEYTGTGPDPAGHAVVMVKDTITNEYHIINFNSHIIQNTDVSQYRYITGGPLKKEKGRRDVPNISKENHLVTENLQGGAPICTLIAASNFKTIFEQCKTMDDVRAKFSGQELIQRLEDVKTLFGNRVIHKDVNRGKTVAEHIADRQQILARQLDEEMTIAAHAQSRPVQPESVPKLISSNHVSNVPRLGMARITDQGKVTTTESNAQPIIFKPKPHSKQSKLVKKEPLPPLLPLTQDQSTVSKTNSTGNHGFLNHALGAFVGIESKTVKRGEISGKSPTKTQQQSLKSVKTPGFPSH